jgi:hypothetical protein
MASSSSNSLLRFHAMDRGLRRRYKKVHQLPFSGTKA